MTHENDKISRTANRAHYQIHLKRSLDDSLSNISKIATVTVELAKPEDGIISRAEGILSKLRSE